MRLDSRIIWNSYTVALSMMAGSLSRLVRAQGRKIGIERKKKKKKKKGIFGNNTLIYSQTCIWLIIILKTKMYSNNRVLDFMNMDYMSCNDLEYNHNGSPDFNKPVPATTFPDAEKEMNFDLFHQKSAEDLACTYEISFEKGFMKEHETVFRKALQKFMESCGISLQLSSNTQLDYHLKNMKEEQASDFTKKLQYYDKLSSFLGIVSAQTPESIAKLLIPVAYRVVEKYDAIKMSEPSFEDILEEARRVTRSVNLEELMTLNGISQSSEKDLVNKAKEFLEIYCATVIVVTAQWFTNPYSDDTNDFKRPFVLSDDSEEDSFEPTPSKKRKFSF